MNGQLEREGEGSRENSRLRAAAAGSPMDVDDPSAADTRLESARSITEAVGASKGAGVGATTSPAATNGEKKAVQNGVEGVAGPVSGESQAGVEASALAPDGEASVAAPGAEPNSSASAAATKCKEVKVTTPKEGEAAHAPAASGEPGKNVSGGAGSAAGKASAQRNHGGKKRGRGTKKGSNSRVMDYVPQDDSELCNVCMNGEDFEENPMRRCYRYSSGSGLGCVFVRGCVGCGVGKDF